MIDAVYRVPVAEKCPVCGGPMNAIYYRIKGLAPWIHCWMHGIARSVTREEHRRFMADKSSKKSAETAEQRPR